MGEAARGGGNLRVNKIRRLFGRDETQVFRKRISVWQMVFLGLLGMLVMVITQITPTGLALSFVWCLPLIIGVTQLMFVTLYSFPERDDLVVSYRFKKKKMKKKQKLHIQPFLLLGVIPREVVNVKVLEGVKTCIPSLQTCSGSDKCLAPLGGNFASSVTIQVETLSVHYFRLLSVQTCTTITMLPQCW